MKKTKWLVFFLAFSVFFTSISAGASSGNTERNGKIYKNTITYETKDKTEKTSFKKKVKHNGKTYILKNVDYDIVDEIPEKEVVFYNEEKTIYEGENFSPESKIIKDNIHYLLESVEDIKGTAYVQPVEAFTSYEKVANNVPSQKVVTVKNKKTGLDENVTCKLTKVSKIGEKWVDSQINFTFRNYDSYVFEWQGVTIKNDTTQYPLKGYEKQLLNSVGLNTSNASVKNTYWTSEAYRQNGILCRNARANIRKKVPVYRANYVGEIKTETITKKMKYKANVNSTSDFNYKIKATATYERDMQLFYTVGVSILILIGLIISVLFYISKKRKTEKKEKTNNE